MNTNHANHAARITTNDPLEESQIVISAAKNALITAVDSLNTQVNKNNVKIKKCDEKAILEAKVLKFNKLIFHNALL